MAFHITDPKIGFHAPGDKTSTLGPIPLGTIVRAVDPDYGEGEFIYLKGASSTVAGATVTYSAEDYTTTLTPTDATGDGRPVAVAMSANLANSYDWYQISGVGVVAKASGALATGAEVYVSGTAGKVYGTASTGKQVVTMIVVDTAATAATTVECSFNRPHID